MHNQSVMYFIFIIVVYASISSPQKNSLNGKHLRVIVMEFPITAMVKRNATGNVVDFEGVLIQHLVALSIMFNFSYSYVFPTESRVEASSIENVGIPHLAYYEADYYLATRIAIASRFKLYDYPASFYNGPFGCIVPFPKEKLNIQASLKPFTYDVWILIASAALTIGLYLNSTTKIISQADPAKTKNPIYVPFTCSNETRWITDFVLGNLVSQGQRFFPTRVIFRIAAGAWCTGCFFLVQIYCSTLISHLTATNQKPIADSVSELANNPGISLTTDRGGGIDILLTGAVGGDFKRLADKFKTNPKLLCNTTIDCLESVRGGNTAYGAPMTSLKVIMENDLKSTGKCNFYMMKEKFLSSNVFTLLRKNSPYTETISLGILRFHQFGLYETWIRWYLPEPRKCMELERQRNITKLSLGHLSSAFVILFTGHLLSILTFVVKKLI